ncbi:MAG: sulfotransferase [bacterium]|nr:sulfotransferase [bacterium]
MISGPRNISTAMMYSFRSRSDTSVFDEPLYAHYLRVSGIDHPGRAESMASMPLDGEEAIRTIILGPSPTPLLFLKNMGHHIAGVGLDLSFLDRVTSFFLIREPAEVITSLIKNLPDPTPEMTGLPQQAELLDHLVARGQRPIVVSSRQILQDPEDQLSGLCERLGIEWDPAMLSWEAGAKPEDGTWAKYWYHRLHESTGFEPYHPKDDVVPDHLVDVQAACEPAYAKLSAYLA